MYYHLGGQPSGVSHALDIVWSKGPRFKSRNRILLMEKNETKQTKNEEWWTMALELLDLYKFVFKSINTNYFITIIDLNEYRLETRN